VVSWTGKDAMRCTPCKLGFAARKLGFEGRYSRLGPLLRFLVCFPFKRAFSTGDFEHGGGVGEDFVGICSGLSAGIWSGDWI
jgi:hypothetical protein